VEKVEFPSAIDKYGDSCELEDGRKCFGPSIALQKFVNDCKEKDIIIVNGEAYRTNEKITPTLLLLDADVYNKISDLAITRNLSPQEFLEIYAKLLADDTELAEDIETDLEKIAETDTVFGEVDYWDNDHIPPSTECHPEKEKPARRIARGGSNIIKKLDDILSNIFLKASNELKIWLGFHSKDEMQLNIDYPEEGVSIKTAFHGDLQDCIDQGISKLT
jgi:hypothetical protein